MRLRACDHYTSSTLIGGKGGAGPSSLPTPLEGPTEYVNARWMWSLHGCLHGIKWIMFHGHLDYFQKPPLGGRSNTKLGDHGTPNAHNRWFILFYHVWGPAWIEIHWNSIWLRARSHMTSHYTWGSVTTLHDFGGVLGRPLDTFVWALTISWSRLLARVWSGPKIHTSTLRIPISVCYYSEVRNAITSYSRVQFFPNESSIGYSNIIINHKWLLLVKIFYAHWVVIALCNSK